jgi:hypothetical protein
MSSTSWYAEATLATGTHVYCAGTLVQCLRRWRNLSDEQKASAVLKMGRDGVPPVLLGAEAIAELARQDGSLSA